MTKQEQKYYSNTLGLSTLADLIHPTTRRIRTARQWTTLALRRGREEVPWTGHQPDLAATALGDDVAASTARARAKKIHDAVTNRI